jgi:rhamnosyltransferase
LKSTVNSIHAIVVTYNPDLEVLEHELTLVGPQVNKVWIVDNGSSNKVMNWLHSRALSLQFELLCLGQNYGIARAQNEGICMAKAAGADYIILFDQDSAPSSNMVSKLFELAHFQRKQGIKVAGVGPNYRDARQENPPPFIRISGLKVLRQFCSSLDAVVEVDYLIASGCLIPMDTLNDVGLMRVEFFIDYVDIEWGLRAKRLGYQSYGVCGATMAHDLGEEPIKFLGKSYPLHSPTRHYYHFRNAVWMYRQEYLPLNWRLVDGWHLLLKFGFYSLFAKPRLKHIYMMTKGLLHGLAKRMGPYH